MISTVFCSALRFVLQYMICLGKHSMCTWEEYIFCNYFVWIRWRWFIMAQMVKVSACNVGDPGSIPGWGRSSGEGNGNPLQYSCLKNSMDGGAWWAPVHGVSKIWTQLSDFTLTLHFRSSISGFSKLSGLFLYILWAKNDFSIFKGCKITKH